MYVVLLILFVLPALVFAQEAPTGVGVTINLVWEAPDTNADGSALDRKDITRFTMHGWATEPDLATPPSPDFSQDFPGQTAEEDGKYRGQVELTLEPGTYYGVLYTIKSNNQWSKPSDMVTLAITEQPPDPEPDPSPPNIRGCVVSTTVPAGMRAKVTATCEKNGG